MLFKINIMVFMTNLLLKAFSNMTRKILLISIEIVRKIKIKTCLIN